MPIYEYKCEKCSAKKELFRHYSQRDDESFCDCEHPVTRIPSAHAGGRPESIYPFTKRFGNEVVEIDNRATKLKEWKKHGLYEMPTNYMKDEVPHG